MDTTHLMRATRRDEHCLSWLMVYSPAENLLLCVQLSPVIPVEVEQLRVDWIMVFGRFMSEMLPQVRSDFARATRAKYIPSHDSSRTVRTVARVHHEVHSIRHIHMKPSRTLATRTFRRSLKHMLVHVNAKHQMHSPMLCTSLDLRRNINNLYMNSQKSRLTRVWRERVGCKMRRDIENPIVSQPGAHS
jgi:hypothetical protein